MKTPILGSAYVARSVNAADNRMINLFPEAVPEGGKEAAFLSRTPGLRLLGTVGDGPIRGIWQHGDYLYVVSGYAFYKVDTNYISTFIGNLYGSGQVSFADNGGVLFIAANGPAYAYLLSGITPTFSATVSGTTMTVNTILYGSLYDGMEIFGTGITTSTTIVSQISGATGGVGTYQISNAYTFGSTLFTGPAAYQEITSTDFAGASVVSYIDTYFVYVEPNSQHIYSVDSIDSSGNYIWPLVFDAFNVASAEGSPDNLVSMAVDHNELWLFGENTVEVWYDAGLQGFPFQRIQGAFNEIGCAATFSVAKMDNQLYWLGADTRGRGIVYRASGYKGERVSTHAIEFAIAQYDTISDAIAYTYQQEGHTFYVLTFPSADATWVFDSSTNLWHERASWEDNQFKRHRSNCQARFNNEIIVGDYANANIYSFDLDNYADNNMPQRWLRSWRALPTGQNDLKRTAHHSLQLDCESGTGVSGATPTTYASYVLRGYYEANQISLLDYTTLGPAPPIAVGYYVFSELLPYGTYITQLYYDNTYFNTWVAVVSNNTLTENAYSDTTFNNFMYGSDPQAMLRWSDDGGHTWSNEHWASIGKIGEYYRRVIWRRLGMTTKIRDRVYEVSGADPIKITIVGAELIARETTA